ncbi:hypothetical protein KA005_36725, partial [bacterium]|nr:hypothetical protein [bacterium]
KMLTKYGASHIMKEYSGEDPIMLTFGIVTEHGQIAVKLPIKIDKIMAIFKHQVNEGLLMQKYYSGEWAEKQAARVGWRIIKDWIDSQITMINIDQAKLEQIFLPYVVVDADTTVYDALLQKKFNFNMLLEA